MGRTAVVIGAGQGMGRAVALKFARNGVHVYLVGRTREKLESVAQEIAGEGGTSTVHVADVSQEHGLDGLLNELGDSLDILVNCAGEALMNAFDDTSFEDWQRIIAENMTTSFVAVKTLLPLLRKSDNPTIVLVASKVALRAAVLSLMRRQSGSGRLHAFAFARPAERGDPCRPLCPGPADTPMRWEATPIWIRSRNQCRYGRRYRLVHRQFAARYDGRRTCRPNRTRAVRRIRHPQV